MKAILWEGDLGDHEQNGQEGAWLESHFNDFLSLS
jgi:hypothetical protein